MADVVSKPVRSRMMAGIRGKNTRPEMEVRRFLYKNGFRFRLHSRILPGKPDLVFRKIKAVIFIHGCFWHGHHCHLFKWPKTRAQFWRKKIILNRKNDRIAHANLARKGWRILHIWECALKGKTKLKHNGVLVKTIQWLKTGAKHKCICGKNRKGK